jgi:FHS family L-fucose permease-like MFS transporter
MVGRFIGSAALQRMKTGPLVGAFAVIAGILVGISMLTSGNLAIWSMLLVGLFNSIMFPSIFTLGTAHMGPLTGKASGLLVMAIVGGAIIPVVQGAIADKIGIHHCFVLPLICYLFIVYYGFIGSRPTGASAELVAAE